MKYLQLIFVALFLSCAKKPPQVAAKKKFVGESNCLEVLKQEMLEAGCPKLNFRHLGPHDIAIRCHKPEEERGKFWDNYIFRISPPHLVYSPDDQVIIDEHTLCIDAGVRIEAYPPEGVK